MLLPDYRKNTEEVFEDAMLHIRKYSSSKGAILKTANMLLLAKEFGMERSRSREEQLNAFFSETPESTVAGI